MHTHSREMGDELFAARFVQMRENIPRHREWARKPFRWKIYDLATMGGWLCGECWSIQDVSAPPIGWREGFCVLSLLLLESLRLFLILLQNDALKSPTTAFWHRAQPEREAGQLSKQETHRIRLSLVRLTLTLISVNFFVIKHFVCLQSRVGNLSRITRCFFVLAGCKPICHFHPDFSSYFCVHRRF